MALFAELADLVLPRLCVCCHQPCPAQWCTTCRTGLPDCHEVLVGQLRVSAAADYGGGLRSALLGYKERGQHRLAPMLADLLAAAISASASPSAVLVPVASMRSAARVRGGQHVLRLGAHLERSGAGKMVPALEIAAAGMDSAGMSAQQRLSAQQHRMTARPAPPGVQANALIVDDILTTGATLTEAARALTAAGWQVQGAAVIAHTRKRLSDFG